MPTLSCMSARFFFFRSINFQCRTLETFIIEIIPSTAPGKERLYLAEEEVHCIRSTLLVFVGVFHSQSLNKKACQFVRRKSLPSVSQQAKDKRYCLFGFNGRIGGITLQPV